MRTCTNCGTQITCGCQDRTASNGTRVCSSCLAFYEQMLVQKAIEASNPQYYSSNTDENTIT